MEADLSAFTQYDGTSSSVLRIYNRLRSTALISLSAEAFAGGVFSSYKQTIGNDFHH